jgi:hypothetical protein
MFDGLPGVKVHHLGPRTAYKISDHHDQVLTEIDPIGIDEKVIFTLGEIDCRIHIYRAHKREGISLFTSINRVVRQYLAYVNKIGKLRDVHVLSVSPTGTKGNVHNFDHYSNRETIKLITLMFNGLAEGYCENRHIPFLNVYPETVDDNNERIPRLIHDDTHLNNLVGKMVLEMFFSSKHLT